MGMQSAEEMLADLAVRVAAACPLSARMQALRTRTGRLLGVAVEAGRYYGAESPGDGRQKMICGPFLSWAAAVDGLEAAA